jgi:hypothetical protein
MARKTRFMLPRQRGQQPQRPAVDEQVIAPYWNAHLGASAERVYHRSRSAQSSKDGESFRRPGRL